MATRRLHHIHRIDHAPKRTHAWVVQVQRRGEITIRCFTDGRYGGKRAAQRAAIRFRDAALRGAQDQRYGLWRRNRKRRNNTSGIVRVGRYISRERRRQGIIERISWQAFWDGPDGRRHGRKFSVNLHGERRARELARHAREDAMRTIFNWTSLPADHAHAESC
jgi:hypothetical protein